MFRGFRGLGLRVWGFGRELEVWDFGVWGVVSCFLGLVSFRGLTGIGALMISIGVRGIVFTITMLNPKE